MSNGIIRVQNHGNGVLSYAWEGGAVIRMTEQLLWSCGEIPAGNEALPGTHVRIGPYILRVLSLDTYGVYTMERDNGQP